MKQLAEMLIKVRRKIKYGIKAEEDDSSPLIPLAYSFDKTPVLCYDNDCKMSRRHKYNEII